MDSKIYDYCLPKYYDRTINWKEVADKFGFESKDSARGQFRRERKRRGDHSAEESRENSEDFYQGEKESTSRKEGDDYIHIVCDSKRIKTREDVIEFFNIDTDLWKIKEFSIRTSESYRKDRKVDWHVKDGKVISGDVDDTGKILIVPLVHTETKFIRKEPDDIWDVKTIDKLFENIKVKNVLPTKIYPSKYSKNGKALIVPLVDFHLGLLTTTKSNGNEYNLEIAEKLFKQTIETLKEKIEGQEFEEIVFVVGNDFLNSDNLQGTTSAGTPQDNSTFWFEIVDKAIELIIYGINSLLEVSKVHVYNVVSNHDVHSMYSVMKVIEMAFLNNKNVTVDTSSLPRKYYKYGKNVIGLTHNLKLTKALELMTTEGKEYWHGCNHFYYILAHLHQAMVYESQGLLEIYRVPTISGFSRWSNEHGFVQTDRKTQCFILDAENGISDSMFIFV